METKASYTLIGIFTLAVLAGVFGFIYWFQNLGSTGERAIYRVSFDGTVSGLRTGGAVLFNGIRVGEVTELKLMPDHPKEVFVVLAVDKATPIRADTRVGLEFQGLTGIAYVSLMGGAADTPPITGTKESPGVLKSDPNATQDVTAAARKVIERVDKLIADNQDSIRGALKNIDEFTGSLARNSERIDSVMAQIDTIAGGVRRLTGDKDKPGEISEAVTSIQKLAENLDKRTGEISNGITGFSAAGTRELQSLSGDARRALGEIERTVRNLDRNPSRVLFGGSGGSTLPEYNGRR